MACVITGCLFLSSGNGGPDNPSSSAVMIQMELIYQYKDSILSCVAGFPPYNGNFPPCGMIVYT